MLRDGDKILVCLSGSSASLCLIHVLRQFSRARQIHIEIGVITLGTPTIDPRVLMLYMRDLGVSFTLEQQGKFKCPLILLIQVYIFIKNGYGM